MWSLSHASQASVPWRRMRPGSSAIAARLRSSPSCPCHGTERLGRLALGQVTDLPGDMGPRLHRHRRQLGQHLSRTSPGMGCGDVAHGPRPQRPRRGGHRQVRSHLHLRPDVVVGSPMARATGCARTPAAQITVRACRTSPEVKRTWSGVTSSTVSSSRTPTPARLSAPSAARCEDPWKGSSNRSRVSTSTTCSTDAEGRVVTLEHDGEELRERPRHLHTRGTAADHDEVELAAVDERRVGIGGLEARHDVVANRDGVLERVQGRRARPPGTPNHVATAPIASTRWSNGTGWCSSSRTFAASSRWPVITREHAGSAAGGTGPGSDGRRRRRSGRRWPPGTAAAGRS